VSQAKLDTALKNTHQSLVAMKGPLDAAEAASRKLGFADDATRSSLARLETATGNTKSAITDLTLAQDVARLKNIDLDAATQMVTSTLAGNARAAKALGLVLLPVTENVFALKEKYKQLGTAIPPAELAQAKILDKMATGKATLQAVTDKVHGQGAAYAATAAGGMAQFHAQLTHIEESIGKALIPALSQGLTAVTGFVTDFAAKLGAAKGFKAKLNVVWEGLGEAGNKIVAAIRAAMDKVDWGSVGQAIVDGISKGLSAARELAGKITSVLSETLNSVNWEKVGTTLGPLFAAAVVSGLATLMDPGFWARHWEEALTVAIMVFPLGRLAGLGGKIVEVLVRPVADLLGPLWGAAMTFAGDVLLGIAERLGSRVGSIFLDAVSFIGNVVGRLPGVILGHLGSIAERLGEKLGSFKTKVLEFLALDAIVHAVEQAVDAIVAWFAGLPGRIGSAFSGAWSAVSGGIHAAFTGVKNWAGDRLDDIVGFFRSLPGRAGDALTGAAGDLKDAVVHLFKDKLLGWVKSALGISSPSKEFEQIGKYMVQGLIKGLEGMGGAVRDKVKGLVTGLSLDDLWSAFTNLGGKLTGFAGGALGGGFNPGGLSTHVLKALQYAASKGWQGTVISGFRTYAEQAALYANFLAGGNIAAPPGMSSHETGNAVDVSDAGTFDRIMAGAPSAIALYNNVPGDFNHFSVSGLAAGGIVTKPMLAVIGERGPEAVVPLSKGYASTGAGPGGFKMGADSGWSLIPPAVSKAVSPVVAKLDALNVMLVERLTAIVTRLALNDTDSTAGFASVVAAVQAIPSGGGSGGGGSGGSAGGGGDSGSGNPADWTQVGAGSTGAGPGGFKMPVDTQGWSVVTPDSGWSLVPKSTSGWSRMAAGGIVMGPTRALIGEKGPEAVVPLDRMGGGGGVTVNVTVQGNVTSEKNLAIAIRDHLARTGRRNPTIFTSLGVEA